MMEREIWQGSTYWARKVRKGPAGFFEGQLWRCGWDVALANHHSRTAEYKFSLQDVAEIQVPG
jgi:hypothetical protein